MLTVDIGVDLGAAVKYMRGIVKSVTLAGASRGTLRIARRSRPARGRSGGLHGRIPAAWCRAFSAPRFVAAYARRASPAGWLPGHAPNAVEPFKQWGGGKVRVVWMTGGRDEGNPCQAGGHHGFAGLDGRVVGTVAGFAKGGG